MYKNKLKKSKLKKFFNYNIKTSNKGSALIMAILIMIVLSLIGDALMTLTVGNFKMSIFYNDVNRVESIYEYINIHDMACNDINLTETRNTDDVILMYIFLLQKWLL